MNDQLSEIFDTEKIDRVALKVLVILHELNPLELTHLVKGLNYAANESFKEYVKGFPKDVQEELLNIMNN